MTVNTATPLSRRSVLRAAGLAGATLVVAGTGALSYRVYDQAVLDPDGGRAFDPWRTWRDEGGSIGAVAAAILAANPHNSQPWAFRVPIAASTSSPIRPGAPARSTAAGASSTSASGVRSRTWSWPPPLAASTRRSHCCLTVRTTGSVAHVSLAPAAPRPSTLHDVIGERHTNRGPYTAEGISAGRPAPMATTTPG